jgi:hypothetical protein
MTRASEKSAPERLPPHTCAQPNCGWLGFRARPDYYIARYLATHDGAGFRAAKPKRKGRK